MHKSTIKKISAAAVVAVLGLSGMSQAASVPYTTGFEASPTVDTAGQSYTVGNLVNPSQNSWTNAPGEPNTGASVISTGAISGGQSVKLSTVGTAGGASTGLGAIYSDYYNGSLTPTIATNGHLTATFKLNTALGTNGNFGAEAGLEVLNGSGNVIASLFAANQNNGTPDLTIYDSTTNGTKQVPFFATAGDGNTGTYSIYLDTSNNTFTVTYAGQSVTSGLGSDPGGLINGIAFATIDQGGAARSATFDDLTVTTGVPEPTSFALIGVGGVMLLAKRPKRLA